jgi:hypothetical protein
LPLITNAKDKRGKRYPFNVTLSAERWNEGKKKKSMGDKIISLVALPAYLPAAEIYFSAR